MAKLINLPNGEQASFPDDMDNSQIEYILQKQFPSKSNKKDNSNFLGYEPGKTEQKFEETSGQVLRESPYVLQGAINEPGKMANVLLPKDYQIPQLNVANRISTSVSPQDIKEAESLGGMLGMGLPRAGVVGGLKAAQGIPHIGNVLRKAMEASPILNKLFDVGGRGGEFGLYEAAEHPENSMASGALGFGLGAGLSALGHGVPSISNKLGFGKQPGANVIEGIKYEDVAPQVEAAERLGTPITPSEATLNPFISSLEAKYPKTRNASYEDVKLGMQRVENEKKSINKLLNTIYEPSVANDSKINKLYQNAWKWNLKPEITNKLKEDPLISRAMEKVSKSPAWQKELKGTPENNYAYLDKTRDALWDKYQSLSNSGRSKEAKPYMDSWKQLTNSMDQGAPVYKKAREEAQKRITRNEIEDTLKKDEVSGSEFYKKIIENDIKYNELLGNLKNVPEAQGMLKDMKLAWRKLKNLPTVSQAAHQETYNTGKIRETLQYVLNKWNQFATPKKNVKAVNFIKSDEWVKKLREAQKSGNKDNVDKAVNDIMMKVLPISDFLLEDNK